VIAHALAAAAHRLGGDRDRVLARLSGPLGMATRDLDGSSQRTRAEWAARARAPVPAGLRGVHPTWIEAALAELPERARAAIAGGASEPADVWLARWATAGFVPLEPVRAGPPTSPADLAALPADDAMRWLAAIGLDQLAHALAGQPAALGPTFAAAQARIASRAKHLGSQRAALERCRGLVPPLDDDRLVLLGARTIAPHVSVLARTALAIRMPKPLGERVLTALDGYAAREGPAWAALVA
jgi:hypothetical protein